MPPFSRRLFLAGLSSGALAALLPGAAGAAVTGFRLGVAEAAARDEVLAAFYRGRGFAGLWIGGDDAAVARRNALLAAMADAPLHGLGGRRHDPEALVRALGEARSPFAQGEAEVELSRAALRLGRDLTGGVLVPGEVIGAIKREARPRDPLALLRALEGREPAAVLRALAPASGQYARLVHARLRLEALIAAGGWGPPVPEGRIEPGQAGAAVVALRDRLIAMGALRPTATASYDAAMARAVERVQAEHGLLADGVAGESTLAALNASPGDRLRSVAVALERERWSPGPRGERHVRVNLCDFAAEVVDAGEATFRTRAVIGARAAGRETPEFSERMSHMVINPSWYVPRSIVVNEYLPQLQRNRNAAGHLRITDSAGREVSRGSVNFGAYSAGSFPFAMHQPPSRSNALGLVKFMFPNPWNIYLHDTPAKDLFAQEVRAFSHGCIRLADPFGFAYHLLARQTPDPEGFFHERLDTGAETRVDLDEPVAIHLDYRTAFADPRGALRFRADVYGRDARIWEALAAEGVEAGVLQG